MSSLFADFKRAQKLESGPLLAATLQPVAPPQNPGLLRAFYSLSNPTDVSADIRFYLLQDRSTSVKLPKQEGKAWVEIFVALWKAVGEVLKAEDSTQKGSWATVFEAWKEVANLLIKGYSSPGFQAWTVPCLYVAGKYLRDFAIKADSENSQGGSLAFADGFQDDVVGGFGKNAKLEEAARVINRMFTLCLSDRAPLEESRKWGIYNTTNLLFKTYFKLNSIGLSKNVLRALEASQADLPPIEAFPKSHIVTFKYYVGVICFVDENYAEAEENLTYAWRMCHRDAYKNKELILTYLIPCHLVTTHTLPTPKLLAPYPRLECLFRPLSTCIKRGDLAGFDEAMSAGEDEFVKRRIYLPLERGRDIAVRSLFRKVFITGGFDDAKEGEAPIRRTRIPVAEFAAAVRLGNKTEDRSRIDFDEVECILANMIYKNLMKGYIARERGIVVLSKGGTAFPGTGV